MGAQRSSIIVLVLFLMFLTISASQHHKRHKKHYYKPCKTLTLFYHQTLYNGHNRAKATAVIVANPPWANQTTLADQFYFGDVIVFDDPVTLDNNSHSTPIGRAQGQYAWANKNTFSSLWQLSFVLNSTDYQGTINLVGDNPILMETREISVVGGTGDFFMHRGIATITTTMFDPSDLYHFSLRFDLNFYECW